MAQSLSLSSSQTKSDVTAVQSESVPFTKTSPVCAHLQPVKLIVSTFNNKDIFKACKSSVRYILS